MSSSTSSAEKHEETSIPSPKECGVCNNEYDEELRCPRIFNCSHTLCSECIENLLKNSSKECPFCRQQFEASTPKDISVNRSTLDFLRYFAELESQMNSVKISENSPSEDNVHRDSSHVESVTAKKNRFLDRTTRGFSIWQETQNENKKLMEGMGDLRRQISQENAKIKNILPDLFAVLSQNDEVLENLKYREKLFQFRDLRLKVIKEKLLKLKTKIEAIAEDTQEDMSEVFKEIENCSHEEIYFYFNFLEERMSEDENTIDKVKKDLELTRRNARCVHKHLELALDNNDPVTLKKEPLGELLFAALRQMTDPVRSLLARKPVFAVFTEGRRQYARISFEDNKTLFVHALRDDPPPSEAFLVEYDDILGISQQPIRRGFFELNSANTGLGFGTMKIRVIEDAKDSSFLHLCMATIIHSFRNTTVKGVDYKGTNHERVRIGDWHEEVWSPFDNEWRRQTKWVAGVIRGRTYKDLTMIEIFTQDNPGYKVSSFGQVEEGINILQESIVKGYFHDVVIGDCGLIIDI